MKATAVLIAMLLWSLLSWRWYTCGIHGLCNDDKEKPKTEATVIEEVEIVDDRPLLFNWDNSEPVVNDNTFAAFKDDIAYRLSDDQILEIVGHYTLSETNTSDYDNMGLARAAKIKTLLEDRIPSTNLHISSKIVESLDNYRDQPFEAADFNYKDASTVEAKVEKVDDKTFRIYFPYKSDDPKMNLNIIEYLNDVTEVLKTKNTSVRVTGYTDNVGSQAYNKVLGMQRAMAIKDNLRSKGVASSQVKIDSRGKLDPIATNETEEGRARNRRVELVFE